MNLPIPKDMQARIQTELANIPAIHGKLVLTFSFNCTMSNVGSLKIKREIETEIRA